MKRKKLVAFLAAAALLVGSVLPAYGAAHYNTWDWNLREAFTGTKLSSPWATYDYDYGTTRPYDDVRAQDHVSVAIDQRGFAYVKVYGDNGGTRTMSSSLVNNSWVSSGWAQVDGSDYASRVEYTVRRYTGGAMDEYNDTII